MQANGRARVSARRPQAFGICDDCGFRYNLVALSWQYEWQGIQLQNTRFLKCRRCLDKPNEQLRAYAVPPDPLPVRNPRTDPNLSGNLMGIETTVVTVASVAPVWLRDGFNDFVTDGFGNPIMLTPGTYQTLLPADTTRNYVDLVAPTGASLWVNPTGGIAGPAAPGCQFIPAGAPFAIRFSAAQSAMTVWCGAAGLNITVESGS